MAGYDVFDQAGTGDDADDGRRSGYYTSAHDSVFVFDNVDVQRVTRAKAAAMTGTVAVLLALGIAGLAMGLDGFVPLWLGIAMPAVLWTTFGAWLVRRRRALRRVVWCVKLSAGEVVGYDYARRRVIIPWKHVRRLDVTSECLTIVGPESASVEVTHQFPEFSQMSHCVMHFADRYGVPVYVDGMPWQQLDVYALFPFLSQDAPHRGSTV